MLSLGVFDRYIFILIYSSLSTYFFSCFEGVFKASNVHFYHLLVLGTLMSKMSKHQPKVIEMSQHTVALLSFQPIR